jgi:hypothetical protein
MSDQMINTAFSIFFSNKYIQELIEREFIKNHLDRILWPDKVHAHQDLLKLIPRNNLSLPVYIPSGSPSRFYALQEMKVVSAVVLSEHKIPKNIVDYDLLISGVNSFGKCQKASDFIVNQLNSDLSTICSLTFLPSQKPGRQRGTA